MAVINELIEKMENDKDFAEKITSASSAEEFEKIAKEAGFDVTEDNNELSDDELEAVAGGYRFSELFGMSLEELRNIDTTQLSEQDRFKLAVVIGRKSR